MGRPPKNTTPHELPTPRSCIAYGLTHENEVEKIRRDLGDDKVIEFYEGMHQPEILENLWQMWDSDDEIPADGGDLLEHI